MLKISYTAAIGKRYAVGNFLIIKYSEYAKILFRFPFYVNILAKHVKYVYKIIFNINHFNFSIFIYCIVFEPDSALTKCTHT